MHGGTSVCACKYGSHSTLLADTWPPLRPKYTPGEGHVPAQKRVRAFMKPSGHSGREFWSPRNQSMAWKAGRGHTSWALGAFCSMKSGMARGEGAQGPDLRTTLLWGIRCSQRPPTAGSWLEPWQSPPP